MKTIIDLVLNRKEKVFDQINAWCNTRQKEQENV